MLFPAYQYDLDLHYSKVHTHTTLWVKLLFDINVLMWMESIFIYTAVYQTKKRTSEFLTTVFSSTIQVQIFVSYNAKMSVGLGFLNVISA